MQPQVPKQSITYGITTKRQRYEINEFPQTVKMKKEDRFVDLSEIMNLLRINLVETQNIKSPTIKTQSIASLLKNSKMPKEITKHEKIYQPIVHTIFV